MQLLTLVSGGVVLLTFASYRQLAFLVMLMCAVVSCRCFSESTPSCHVSVWLRFVCMFQCVPLCHVSVLACRVLPSFNVCRRVTDMSLVPCVPLCHVGISVCIYCLAVSVGE